MSKNDSTEARQAAICDLLKKREVSDQKELVELLSKYFGIKTNQAVISRDLHKLSVFKQQLNGVLVYTLPQTDVKTEILKLALIDISHNEAMIVIQTYPGLAAFVGDFIDADKELEVLGCLAGENAVLVIPKSIKKIEKTYELLCDKFNFKKRIVN